MPDDEGARGSRHDRDVRTGTPAWLAETAEDAVVAARPARWGFRHETWIVERPDGRFSVFQRRLDGSDPTDPNARRARDLVRAAGLPVPEPERTVQVAGGLVVTLPMVDGTVAAELLDTVAGAALAGRVCGLVAARLAGLDARGIRLSRVWASGAELRTVTLARIERLGESLDGATRRLVLLTLERAALEADALEPRLAHGDLAPVNVLVKDDGLAAVLDLDRMQLAHPGYDAAWFSWVVSFHHRDVAATACDGFARAAGLAGSPMETLAWMWPLLMLERLAEAQPGADRARWMTRLAALSTRRDQSG